MNTFKLRAECEADVKDLRVRLGAASIYVSAWYMSKPEPGFSDVELVFASKATIDQIKACAKLVMDGHVMVQTLALENEYTGERCYDV